MAQFNPAALTGLAFAAVLALGSPSLAATATTMKTATAPKLAPQAHAVTHAARAHPAAGRMVHVRLANGKTVTYNCSLPGNQTKQACKR